MAARIAGMAETRPTGEDAGGAGAPVPEDMKRPPERMKAPGVSLASGKEMPMARWAEWGRLRFDGIRPPFAGADSIVSQAEALAHRGAHLGLFRRAAVLAGELDRVAALQDAVEDAPPRLVARVVHAGGGEVGGDYHGPAGFVASVDDGVDVLHHVAGVALRAKVLDEEQVVGEDAVEVALPLLEGGLHQVDDVADVRLEGGESEVYDAVRYRRGHVGLAGAHVAGQQQAVGVPRVERRRVALADGRGLRCPPVVAVEGAVAVEAAGREALVAPHVEYRPPLHVPLAGAPLLLLAAHALAGDGDEVGAAADDIGARAPHLLGRAAPPADEDAVPVDVIAARLPGCLGHRDARLIQRLAQFLHVTSHPFFPRPLRAVSRPSFQRAAHLLGVARQIAVNASSAPHRCLNTCRRRAFRWRSCNRRRASP